jgi:hypothetical protein
MGARRGTETQNCNPYRSLKETLGVRIGRVGLGRNAGKREADGE